MIRFSKRKSVESSLNVAPLIDIVLLLLIFFLLTSVFMEPGLKLVLPEARTAAAGSGRIVIQITQDGQVYLNAQPVSWAELKSRLQARLASSGDKALVVKADRNAPFGAFVKVERGEMALTDENRALLTKMIRYSSNRAATEMLNRVGKAYLAAVLQDPRYRLYCEALNGGLWVGKEYGRGVAWKRDPLHHLSHGATAIQTARLYYLLESGQLLRPDLAAEMKTILGDPGIEHKFVKGLKKAAPEAVIYRKSGSWRHYHADSAIVEHDGRRYIAVALAQDPNGGQWLSRLIVAMDELIRQPRPVAWLKH